MSFPIKTKAQINYKDNVKPFATVVFIDQYMTSFDVFDENMNLIFEGVIDIEDEEITSETNFNDDFVNTIEWLGYTEQEMENTLVNIVKKQFEI